MKTSPIWYSTKIKTILLFLAVVLTFFPALQGNFIWDDTSLIAQNAYIKEFRHLGRNLSHHFWDVSFASEELIKGQANVYFRPFVTLSFMFDYWLYGLKPWGYHFTNLLLHLLTVALAYRFTSQLLPNKPVVTWFTTLVFAIHPSRAEAVSWISGRTDIMMAIFFMLALILFRRALSQQRQRIIWLIAAWVAYILAVLSKESAITLALFIPILDWLVISKGERQGYWRNAKWCHLPLVVVTAIFLIMRLHYQAQVLGPRPGLKAGEWIALVLQSVAHYGLLIIYPFKPNMQIGAYYTPASPSWLLVSLGLFFILIWIVAIGYAYRRLKEKPEIVVALIFFAICIVPVVNLFPLSIHVMVAERFLYLPLWGIALLAGIGFDELMSRPLRRPLVVMLAIFLLLASWGVTINLRSRDFSDPLRFWKAEIAASPNNPLAEMNLAHVLVGQQRYAEAETWFFRSFVHWRRVVGNPDEPLRVLLRLIDVRLLRTSDNETQFLQEVARFLSQLVKVAEQPHSTKERATLSMGDTQLTLEIRTKEMHKTIKHARLALLTLLGNVKSRLGDDGQAEKALFQAWTILPMRMATLMNLTLIRARARNLKGAWKMFENAKNQAPDSPKVANLEGVLKQAEKRVLALQQLNYLDGPSNDPQVHWLLAELYLITKAPLRVIHHLREIIRLLPDNRKARAMLAMELSANGDLRGALQVVEEARKVFGQEPGLVELEQQVKAVRRVKYGLMQELE